MIISYEKTTKGLRLYTHLTIQHYKDNHNLNGPNTWSNYIFSFLIFYKHKHKKHMQQEKCCNPMCKWENFFTVNLFVSMLTTNEHICFFWTLHDFLLRCNKLHFSAVRRSKPYQLPAKRWEARSEQHQALWNSYSERYKLNLWSINNFDWFILTY